MNIAEAKQQIKDTIEVYLATDELGAPYIDTVHQRPVFLIGAPGIGKTAIIHQVSRELGIGLVAYSMTHHTRQSALGLPFIVHKTYKDISYDASEYTMSEIIASIYEYMDHTGLERGILFLDEINCVSETLYPSMLQFLQFKTFGRHRVPDGWVIVTAGNPPEYNRSVHEFDIVTLDRVKRIAIEPSFDAWKPYAQEAGIHAAVTTFLEIKKDRFYHVATKIDGKSFVTARGWEDLSRIITLYEREGKTVDLDLIEQYLQDSSIAEEFALYYDLFAKYRSDYQIDAILAGNADESITTRAQAAPFDERLSLLGLLLDSVGGAMRETLETEALLTQLRDAFREAKEKLAAQQANNASEGANDDAGMPPVSLAQLLSQRAAAIDENLADKLIASTFLAEKAQTMRRLSHELKSFSGAIERACLHDDASAYEFLREMFASKTFAFKQTVANVEAGLHHLFEFIETAYGPQQEMLILVTELSTRPHCARFLAHFGNEDYFAHNKNLLLAEREMDLKRRIEDLDLG